MPRIPLRGLSSRRWGTSEETGAYIIVCDDFRRRYPHGAQVKLYYMNELELVYLFDLSQGTSILFCLILHTMKQEINKYKEEHMFCYQCEQTGKDGGCTNVGVCGKKPDVAALQDLLVYTLEELGFYAVEARKSGISCGQDN